MGVKGAESLAPQGGEEVRGEEFTRLEAAPRR